VTATTISDAKRIAAVPDLPVWDLTPLLDAAPHGAAASADGPRAVVIELLDRAMAAVGELDTWRGRVGTSGGADLAALMRAIERATDLLERAQSYAHLDLSTSTTDEARGALVALVDERVATISNDMVFAQLEWAALPDETVLPLLADPRLSFCAHHLRVQRLSAPYLLSEAEERVLSEKSVTGVSAWNRLFDESLSSLQIRIGADGEPATLDAALSRLHAPDRNEREGCAQGVTDALAPGLRMRTFLYNTVMADKATDDRLRGYATWVSSRNLANQATDASVAALVDAVWNRFDIVHRWYEAKRQVLGVDALYDYDRYAPLGAGRVELHIPWAEAVDIVLDAYASFSPTLADAAAAFITEQRVHAADTPGKRGGAYCSPVVPGLRPYVFINYTETRRDVLTLAHELGHGVHFDLGRRQGIFHTMTPLTVAETASVFGEEVTFGRLLASENDPQARLSLLAEHVEGHIATVFRQVAMFGFEDRAHRARRRDGELATEQLNVFWEETQHALLGDAVTITPGYRTWWSYIPHFVHVPGYVYAYAFGQLLALSVYQRSIDEGPSFAPRYLDLLAAGGSESPEALAARVGCDLSDPAFWDGGLRLVDDAVRQAEAAIAASGPNPNAPMS
jgi:oligoendopeptidase F